MRSVEHVGGLGVVVDARRAPVVHELREVEVVGTDALASRQDLVGRVGNALLDGLAGNHDLEGARRDHNRRDASGTAHALLHAGRGNVDAPLGAAQVVTRKGGRGVGVEQGAVGVADVAQALERLEHGGGGVASNRADELGRNLLNGGLNLGQLENAAPVLGDHGDVSAHARSNLGKQRAKAASRAHEHLVTGGNGRDERTLNSGTRRAVDHKGLVARRLEAVAQHVLDLAHDLEHVRVELAHGGSGHSREDARVDSGGAGRHKQAVRRVNAADGLDARLEGLVHGSSPVL